MKKALIVSALVCGLAGIPLVAHAFTLQELFLFYTAAFPDQVVVDGCEGNNDGTDAEQFFASCTNLIGTEECLVFVKLCGDLSQNTKYRIHFDTEEPYFDDDADCLTTSDETFMFRPRGSDPENGKYTGPEYSALAYSDNSNLLMYSIPWSELNIGEGDYVAMWLDIHQKGIQDRAPDTYDGDGCAEPQDSTEVIESEASLF